MTTLDLHGMYHDAVERRVENFILMNDTPLKIITGNSHKMRDLVINVLDRHSINYEIFRPSQITILGE